MASFNWQKNLKTVKERIGFLYNNKVMSDFNFIVGSTETVIPGHKFILSATSEIFYNMFYMIETDDTDVHVPNIPCLSFLEFLNYVYKDEIILSMNNVKDILQLSVDYEIFDLKMKCVEFLKQELNYSNIFKFLQTSVKFNIIDLQDKCLKIIGTNAKLIFRESNELMNTDQKTFEIILQSKYFECTEYEIFLGINKWIENYCLVNHINKNAIKRKELNNKLFNFLKYDNMSVEEFKMCTTHDVLTAEQIGTIFQKLLINEPKKSRNRYEEITPYIILNRFKSTTKIFYINHYTAKTDLYFNANKPIYFCGLGIFGPTYDGCNMLGSQEIRAELMNQDNILLGYHKQVVHYNGTSQIYEIIFETNIILRPYEDYYIIVKRSGNNNISVEHHTGYQGQGEITIEDVTFIFKEEENKRYNPETSSRLAGIIFHKT